jgi:hypothetical protein
VQTLLGIEAERAAERQKEGGQTHGRGRPVQLEQPSSQVPEPVPEAIDLGDARDKAGAKLGISGKQAERLAALPVQGSR